MVPSGSYLSHVISSYFAFSAFLAAQLKLLLNGRFFTFETFVPQLYQLDFAPSFGT